MNSLFNRIFRRRAIDAEVREEIDSHVAMRTEMNRQAGMTEEDAARAARRQFGNTASIREQIYSFNGFEFLDALSRDVRSGLRALRRYPGLTSAALFSLALGVGANTVAFSLVNVLLFRSLPYPEPNRIVMMDDGITPDECVALRQLGREIFAEFGCFTDGPPGGASMAEDSPGSLPPEHVFGQHFTAGMGRALAVNPLIGRWFSETKESDAAGEAVVISHRLWQRRFGGRSDVLGKLVRIDGDIATIVGVMPDEFQFLASNVDYWLPMSSRALANRNQERILGTVARLRPTASVAQAQSRLDAVIANRPAVSSDSRKQTIEFTQMDHLARTQYQDAALLLQGIVTFILLIACANVSGLLLAQAVSQQREVAVRAALGSGKWRIVRQVLIQSVVLFCAGGLLGLAAGWAGVRLMVNVVFPFSVSAYGEPRGGLPRGIAEAGLDSTVLLFTFVVCVVCGLAAAIAPALQTLRSQPVDVLRESNPRATSGAARQRLRSVFVMMQIALALVLLIGTALMLNGLASSLNQDVGFDPGGLLTVRVQLPDRNVRTGQLNSEQMRQNLAGVSGVVSVTGIAIYPPLSGAVNLPVEVENGQSETEYRPQFLPVLPDYFKTLQVSIVQGREFSVRDTAGSAPAAIVNEAAAQHFWPGESAIGKNIHIRSPQMPSEGPRQVIGVVREIMQYPSQQSRPQLYVPYAQLQAIEDARLRTQLGNMTFVVRTLRPAAELAAAAREAISRADRTQAVSSIRTMQQTAFAASQRRGVFISLIGFFGAIAIVLAVIGVYGVIANIVGQRSNEFGIRLALGASPGQIRRLVMRHGARMIGIGLLAGVALCLAVSRVIRGFLFGTSPTAPLPFVVGIILLGGAAFLACCIPAWRASRIDALLALRHD